MGIFYSRKRIQFCLSTTDNNPVVPTGLMIIENAFCPQLLTNKSRLREIYDLRVVAWENSEMKDFINKEKFPCGWFDQLDKEAYHWIIEDNGTIVSSSRICILQYVEEIEENFRMFSLPNARPFSYFSRLVIHPKYRSKGFAHLMDNIRIDFLRKKQIPFALAFGSEPRRAALERLGFIELGNLRHQFSDNGKVDVSPAFILHANNINSL